MSVLPRSLAGPAAFDAAQLRRFGQQLEKMYNKKVEFNIVNHKYAHLNSDILAESIATQLKDRKSTALRVMKRATMMARLPTVKGFDASKQNQPDLTRHFGLLGLDESGRVTVPDTQLTPASQAQPLMANDAAGNGSTNVLEQLVLRNLKNKTIAGVRIRAAGRLSKRLTANRAMAKIRQAGSYSKIPANTVLGYARANLQTTMLHGKTRNGAFGVRVHLGSR